MGTTLVGNPWQLFVNGSSCYAGREVKVHIVSNSGLEHHYMVKLAFKTTNKEAKYEALVVGFSIAEALAAIEVEVKATFK